jgi:hypothetical protein
MTKPQAGIVIATLLIGLHLPTAAQQSNAGPQAIAHRGASSLQLDPDTVNVLKANVAARSASLAESTPKGFWIQSWNDPQQTFAWTVQVPQAGEYSVSVLVSGAPGGQIEIAGLLGGISVTIPDGNDHWDNNWNKIPVPGWLAFAQGTPLLQYAAQTRPGSPPTGTTTRVWPSCRWS